MSATAPADLRPPPGPWRTLWRRLRGNRVACLGGVILVALYLAACLAGFLAPYDPTLRGTSSSRSPPALFGGFDLVESSVAGPGGGPPVAVFAREFRWFAGGVHFRDGAGNFTFRPHVHPILERSYLNEHGETDNVFGIADRSVSLPVEFLVRGEEHEMFSLLGLPGTAIRGPWRLFGVRAPEGTQGVARIYLLGSDASGRDILSRLLFGAQISLSVGVVAILFTTLLGMFVGGVSGYFGRWVDLVAMRVTEVVLSVPDLYLIIVVGGLLRNVKVDDKPLSSRATYFLIIGALVFVGWAVRARVIRGMVLSLRETDYVVAARAAGIPTPKIIAKHILPNTFGFAIVSASLAIPSYILGEVALSYLGLGIQEPEPSWGNMLREAQEPSYLADNLWIAVPGVFIFLTVLAYNFLGDGLRDAADPKAVIARKMRKDLKKAQA